MINNKKAGFLMGEFTVQIIVSVIVIVLLIVLVFGVYGFFTDENEIEKAKKQLEKLVEVSDNVYLVGDESRVEFFSVKNWYLKTFEKNNFPLGQCGSSSNIDCICVCEVIDCSGKNLICKEVGYDIMLDSVDKRSVAISGSAGPGGAFVPGENINEETFQLTNSVYSLGIFKENEGIKIRVIQ